MRKSGHPLPPRAGGDPAGARRSLGLGGLVLVAGAAWVAWQLRPLLAAVAAAVLLASALEPVVARASRLRLGRWAVGRGAAAFAALGALAGLAALVAALLVPALGREIRDAAEWIPSAIDVVRRQVERWEQELGGPGSPWLAALQEQGARLAADAGRAAGALLLRLVTNVLNLLSLFVVPVGAYYLMADGPGLKAFLLRHLQARQRARAEEILDVAARSLSLYVRGQTMVCLAAAVLYSLLFAVLGLPNPLLLGSLAGVAEAVPLLGATASALLVGLAGMTVDLSRALLAVAAYLVVANTLVNYALAPRLLSSHLDMHPFVILLAVLAGSALGGLVGALLALPAAVVAQSLAARTANGVAAAGAAAASAAAGRVEPGGRA